MEFKRIATFCSILVTKGVYNFSSCTYVIVPGKSKVRLETTYFICRCFTEFIFIISKPPEIYFTIILYNTIMELSSGTNNIYHLIISSITSSVCFHLNAQHGNIFSFSQKEQPRLPQHPSKLLMSSVASLKNVLDLAKL